MKLPEEIAKGISGRILTCRKRLGLSQVQLAKACGVYPTTVSKWELGVTMPYRHMGRLAAALNISTDFLLAGVATPEAETSTVSSLDDFDSKLAALRAKLHDEVDETIATVGELLRHAFPADERSATPRHVHVLWQVEQLLSICVNLQNEIRCLDPQINDDALLPREEWGREVSEGSATLENLRQQRRMILIGNSIASDSESGDAKRP